MGKASRDKGNRAERALVRYLQGRGRAAERIPLSGAAGGSFAGDVSVPVMGDDWRVEVKVRAHGFAQLYGWLGDNQALVIRADRQRPLVVLPLDTAIDILDAAEQARAA